jgi:alkylhydroperoxidase family enzyme
MARLPPPAAVPAGLTASGVLAHSPDVLRAFLGLYGRLWRDGVVDHPTKEVVRLRNARITDCGY